MVSDNWIFEWYVASVILENEVAAIIFVAKSDLFSLSLFLFLSLYVEQKQTKG